MAVTITSLSGTRALKMRKGWYKRIVKVDFDAEVYNTGGVSVPHNLGTLHSAVISGPASHLYSYNFSTSKLQVYTAVGTEVADDTELTLSGIRIVFEGTH